MACGMSIIAAAKGETERVIKEAACGICVKTGDAEGLAKGILELVCLSRGELKKWGNNGRQYCDIYFNKEMLMDRMDVIILKRTKL